MRIDEKQRAMKRQLAEEDEENYAVDEYSLCIVHDGERRFDIHLGIKKMGDLRVQRPDKYTNIPWHYLLTCVGLMLCAQILPRNINLLRSKVSGCCAARTDTLLTR